MSKPYSYDLSQKVMETMGLDGLKISGGSAVFSISRNTIGVSLKLQAETVDFQALRK